MRYIKRTAACLLVLLTLMLAQVSVICVSAEAQTAIQLPGAVTEGESFEVTLSFTADAPIAMVEADLVYDSSLVAFTGGSGTDTGGATHIKEFTEEAATQHSTVLTFTAKAAGEVTFTLSNCTLSSPEGTPDGASPASAVITVNADASTDESSEADQSDESSQADNPDESGRGLLKSLAVSEGELIPEFSPYIYDYVVKVGYEVESIETDAELMYEHDYIWFEGSKKLSETGTKRTVTVQDTDPQNPDITPSYKNVYTILVERAPAPESEAESSAAEEVSSAQETVVTQVTPAQTDSSSQADTLSRTSSQKSSKSDASRQSGMSELRQKLMPWLFVILAILLIALCIIVIWIKNKSLRKRKKIKTTHGKK